MRALLPAALLAAVSAAGPLPAVGSVTVEGNDFVSDSLIVRYLGVGPGDDLTPSTLGDGTRALFNLGYFSDIEMQVDTTGGLAELVVLVSENRLLSGITFEGMEELRESDVLDTLTLLPGQTVSPSDVEGARQLIKDLYEEEHRHLAEVTAEWLSPDAGGRSTLVFRCDEGPDVRVGEIAFTGNTVYSDRKLRGRMDTREDSFWRSGRLRESDLAQDLREVESWYHERGYPEASVREVGRTMMEDGRHLRLELEVDEGRYFTFGDVTFDGNESFPDSTLAEVVEVEPGEEYDASELETSVMGLYEAFQELGYFYSSVEPEVTVGEDGESLDVAFTIEEGERAHIRRVDITGNTRTLDNVIRREIRVMPGDLFRRSTLMRSYRNIFYLNYFQDVQVDFSYIEGSPDVDVLFDVTEKTTGTAGGGVAYGGGDGLSGFVEVAENNLFGTGQRVSASFQISDRRWDLKLGFTEPWLMDTPLSLGGEVFHTTADYSEYDRRRTGGSVTVGRPIPWLDYTSATVSYTLEKVDVYNITSDSTSFYYSLRDEDWPRWTSSTRLTLGRDSRDRQVFASEGSLNSITAEFAGGALGGSVAFQKYLLDSGWFVPTFWNFSFFLRGRLGTIGSLEGEEPPAYELFELGGTGFYGVRGYGEDTIGAVEGYRTVGGRSMLILTAEYRCRVIDQIQLSVFADAGNTWSSWAASDFTDLNRGLGAGIRIEVPMLGILGFDYAYGFDGPDRGWEPHFQFGTTF